MFTVKIDDKETRVKINEEFEEATFEAVKRAVKKLYGKNKTFLINKGKSCDSSIVGQIAYWNKKINSFTCDTGYIYLEITRKDKVVKFTDHGINMLADELKEIPA